MRNVSHFPATPSTLIFSLEINESIHGFFPIVPTIMISRGEGRESVMRRGFALVARSTSPAKSFAARITPGKSRELTQTGADSPDAERTKLPGFISGET